VLKKDFVFPFESPAPVNTIGKRIRLVRDKNGMSESDFAKAVGVRTNTVRRWEQDKFTTSLPKFIKISELFNVPVEWLAEGVGADSDPFIGEPTDFAPAEIKPPPADALKDANEDVPVKNDLDQKHFGALYSSLSEYRRGMVFGYITALCNEEMVSRGAQPSMMYKI
jgi:transcriptional regulator with XRE-family HTH domain